MAKWALFSYCEECGSLVKENDECTKCNEARMVDTG